MNYRIAFLNLLFLTLSFSFVSAQTGSIRGVVVDKINNEAIPFTPVIIMGTSTGATTGEDGAFEIKGIKPGVYNISVSALGYKKYTLFDLEVKNTRVTQIKIELEQESRVLNEIDIKPEGFVKPEEAPVSLNTIGEVEIKRNPGANRDISKALQSLPGVAATASFRNDLIIRGGSSNENRFYLDGIEVPNINHFSTQGATGGPVGMINVDFIREVDFYSGSFPAAKGNALSSILDFKLKDGYDKNVVYSFTLGASDLAATVEGPLSPKTSFIASWRRSYLQFLFKALGLPFLPNYDDFLLKTKIKINGKNEITILGLGAIDKFKLNLDQKETKFQQYLLGNLPVNTQWNYTGGLVYKHYGKNGYTTVALSRNALNNEAVKYRNNDASDPSNLILDYRSTEEENKLRVEHTNRFSGFKLTYGIGGELARYTNSTFNRLPFVGTIRYASQLDLFKYAAFAQLSKDFFNDKLSLSLGVRGDASDFNKGMRNPLQQLSPRFSASYAITQKFRLNANIGRYYQLPSYTILGYRNTNSELVNKQVSYIRCDHLVGGVEYSTPGLLRVTVEGFVKNYSWYPFDLRDSISIANQGSDFGVVGTVPVSSENQGRSYGAELLLQQKMNRNFYGILAYTFVHSEFQDYNGKYIASSWDFRHIISLTVGKYFKKNWELGGRFRFNSGSPYTPYNVSASMEKSNFDITGQGILDKRSLNSLRTKAFHQLDVRVDKKYFFKKWSLNLYLDIQNIYNNKTMLAPYLSVQRDNEGNPLTNPNASNEYLPDFIPNESGSVIPTVGFVVEF